VPAFVRRYAPRVCQSGLNTDNDSSVTAEPHRVDSSRVESSREADRVRRLREWFESRPYTGGVVPSAYNYRKLASFCRAVSCPPFLIPRLTLAARFFRRPRIKRDDLCTKLTVHFQNLDIERVLNLAQRVLEHPINLRSKKLRQLDLKKRANGSLTF